MNRLQVLKSALIGGASALALANPAAAKVFDIPRGDLATALDAYMRQAGVEIVYSDDVVRGHKSHGAKGDYTETAALTELLRGSGFTAQAMPANIIGIVPQKSEPMRVAQAARRAATAPTMVAPATVETVVVTAQKKSENIQNVPIAVTALSQAQLTERQIAGGPDLVKEVPNLTFSKTNFTGYNLQIRGIGTQAISVTTDPAVAVAFNSIPFIRNHFFEQEFYDLQDVEVLRGPQGTLYGRNATAGVVNIKSALPTDEYEAMLSADLGNFSNRRLEGMLNLPIVGDKLDLRIAGEWTKRDGYSFNEVTGVPIDGRDLWSGRVTLGWKPSEDMQVYLVWEHFQEGDDRLRSGKQLCKTAQSPTEVDGVPIIHDLGQNRVIDPSGYLNQGCVPVSLYSPQAFEVPNGNSIAYYNGFAQIGAPIQGGYYNSFDPYASTTQSTNLRAIESSVNPIYRAKNDTLELNAEYKISPSLAFTSQTGFNRDFLWSAEDFNRFNTRPGAFAYCDPSGNGCDGLSPNSLGQLTPDPDGLGYCSNTYYGTCSGSTPYVTRCIPDTSNFGSCQQDGVFCDPQIGCSDRLVLEDLSEEHSWQMSQEFRLASSFSGPLNFSVGANFLHYETEENYYVFINSVTLLTASRNPSGGGPFLPWVPGVTDDSYCSEGWFAYHNPRQPSDPQSNTCVYVDPNPITSVNNEGHNYFLSQNPYVLNSYAGFGEAYYNITPDLKITGGLRWTSDHKHFIDIPSELLVEGYGYPATGVVDQQWNQWTGRAVVDWTPQLDFTDQTLIYGSFSHGYKGGGANPPGAVLLENGRGGEITNPIHPLTFKPEFIDAYELGTKNTMLDGGLTLNGDIFYYDYKNYQISRIVDRTSINDNFNATVRGAELEAMWEPLPGLKFNFSGGYENATLDNGDYSVDLMDRTAGNPGWMVVKPFVTQASNCILPTYVVAEMLLTDSTKIADSCGTTYGLELDPVTNLPYVANPTERCSEALPANVWDFNCGPSIISGYAGFNPLQPGINNGQGFDKNLGGNQLPNAPHFTTSLSADYSLPVTDDWAATLHGDFYWQSQSWARVFNDRPYDKIHGYSNVNLALILTSDNGWQVMGYVKNVFDTTAITGAFLNSDDTALTTNVFLTDPRLFGVRVTKQLDQNDGFWGSEYSGYDLFRDLFADADNDTPPLWIQLGGQLSRLDDTEDTFVPPLFDSRPAMFAPSQNFEHMPRYSLDEDASVSFRPDGLDWTVSASIRYGHSARDRHVHQQTSPDVFVSYYGGNRYAKYASAAKFADTEVHNSERHLVLDFQAGKDVGLGNLVGSGASSSLNLGIRIAQFEDKSSIALKSIPDWRFHYISIGSKSIPLGGDYHANAASLRAERNFHGIGPTVSWNGSLPIAGDKDANVLTFDWGANAALLFGRQRANVHHQVTAEYHSAKYGRYNLRNTLYQTSKNLPARERTVAVPNLGGFAGVSYRYRNAKISFGYRADEFFGAMDGGIDRQKSENVGFFGPFANIGIGVGG